MADRKKRPRNYRHYSRRMSERDFDLVTLPIRAVYAPMQWLNNILGHSPKRAKRLRKAEDKLMAYSERRQRRFEQRYKGTGHDKKRRNRFD